MPDQTARHDGLGVAVWRYDSGPMGPLYDEGGPTEILGATPGKWLPTDAEALAEIHHLIELAIDDARSQGLGISSQARGVMRELFGAPT